MNLIFDDIMYVAEAVFSFLILLMLHSFFDIYFVAVPSMPTGPLEITDVQRTNISIKWKAPADDGGAPIIAYSVEKKHSKAILWSKIDEVDASTFGLTVHGLYEKNEYFFRVSALNRIGHSSPLETDAATLARSPFGKFIYIFDALFNFFTKIKFFIS